jgi:hypothetical protein
MLAIISAVVLLGAIISASALLTSPLTRSSFLSRSALSMTTAVQSARKQEGGLGLQLDEGTRKSHSVAENTAFVRLSICI